MVLDQSGRNHPCPCGSGKRYKHCHGGVASFAPAPPELSPDALTQRGMAAHQRGDLDAAQRDYQAALALAPAHPGAMHYLGVALYQRDRLDGALPLLEQAATLVPHEPEFHNNHGLALAAAGDVAAAMAAYRRALALAPGHALAWNNLGLGLQLAGDVNAAIDALRRALQLRDDFAQAHWNLALTLLLAGRYAEAWPHYEWRLRAPELQALLPTYPGERWNGQDPNGRTLLLTAEQGLGDTLQNVRFASMLVERGARVRLAVQRPVVALAGTAPGVTSAHAIGDALPAFDAHVSLMSLPGLLGVTTDRVTVPVPYLRADARLREEARARIDAVGDGLKVGLAWTGAAGNSYNPRRTCPLAALRRLLDLPDVAWFSLQRSDEDIADPDVATLAPLHRLDLRDSFDGTAAMVAALDLVISVDTSLAHLAGAMARPVWILLPFAPDWRWMVARDDDSPWYPTARLFRQRAAGDWSAPVGAMRETLRALALGVRVQESGQRR
jgi:Flp pilus assembly protein TadD